MSGNILSFLLRRTGAGAMKPPAGEFGHSEVELPCDVEPPPTADPVGCETALTRDDLIAASADFIDAQGDWLLTLMRGCMNATLTHEQLVGELNRQITKARTVAMHLRRCV